MKKILIILYLISIHIHLMALDTNIVNLFPLNIGNRWTWYREAIYSPGPGMESMKIWGTRQFNNKLYYGCFYHVYTYYGNQQYISTLYYRVDSISGNIYKYDSLSSTECLIDSLNSSIGDSAYSTCSNQWFKCYTGTYNIFGQNMQTKDFIWSNYFEAGSGKKYAYNIGKVYALSGGVMNWTYWYLRGCVINGILYGDTNMYLGIIKISSEVPNSFSLYQNYPNPFNPVTKIKFAVPPSPRGEGQGVRFIIYDALGREITTLINEQLQHGTYEVEWDGSNYSSGVYYYTLAAGNYIETKKMVFIK